MQFRIIWTDTENSAHAGPCWVQRCSLESGLIERTVPMHVLGLPLLGTKMQLGVKTYVIPGYCAIALALVKYTIRVQK